MVPQLKKYLISEGQLAREMGWSVNARVFWKWVLNDEGDALIKGMIVDDSNLYVVDPAYLDSIAEGLQMELTIESGETSVLFAGMANVVKESEEEQFEKENLDWWLRMHSTPVLRDMDPIHQVRQIAWDNWIHTYHIDDETPVPRLSRTPTGT